MFSKQESKDITNNSLPTAAVSSKDDIPSIIAGDLKIVGNLICGGAIEIEGEIEGNVTCGQVTVRRTGAIKGDVTAENIQVDGEINGLVKGKNITLSDSGRVTGVIIYESLSVKDGAYIDGQCRSADQAHQGTVEKLELEDASNDDDTIDVIEVQEEIEEAEEEEVLEVEEKPKKKKEKVAETA